MLALVRCMHEETSGSDTRLRDQLLAGDEAAFETLVSANHGAMLRFARHFISRADVAEEVVQETWLAVLKGLAAFEGRSSLRTWIFHILANRARTRAVREGRVIPFADLGAPEDEALDPDMASRFGEGGSWSQPPASWEADTPESILLRQEAMNQFQAALEQFCRAR